MTITAKYPSRCTSCGGGIQQGEKIEWSKGGPVRHSVCPSTPSVPTTPVKRSYRRTTCVVCGHVEQRGRYPDPDRILKSGECVSCYQERKMGY